MATVDAVVRQNPFLAAAAAPEHPQVRMALAITEFTLRNGRVGEATRAAATDALRKSALAEQPFLLAGVQAIADGDPARGQRLLEESRRRNPRSRLTRLLLLDRYLRQNRVEAAGVEISALTRLIPQAGAVLAPELARMARDPKMAAPVGDMLARNPELRGAVLAQLAGSGAPTELILGIARGGGGTAGAEWQGVLMNRLIGQGDVAGAYRLWSRFAGLPPASGAKGLYDPRFAGAQGGPPFNWELTAGAEGVAERVAGPALQVDYYGRVPVTLARQLLMLGPGAYSLRFRAEGDAKGEASRLAWVVSCSGSKARLADVALTGINASPRTLAGRFTVPPSGCAAQWLSLEGTAGDVPSDEAATISGLQLTAGGGR